MPEDILSEFFDLEGPEGRFLRTVMEAFLLGTARVPGEKVDLSRFSFDALSWAARHAAALVSNIDGNTQAKLSELTQRGIREGWNPARFQQEVQAQDSSLFGRDRALTIGRTEAAQALNAGEAIRWSGEGITHVKIHDGECCDEACRHADGQIWTVQEYQANLTAHPNCIRRAIPVRREVSPSEVGHSIDRQVFPHLKPAG